MLLPAVATSVNPQLGKVAVCCDVFFLASTPLMQTGCLCHSFASSLSDKQTDRVVSVLEAPLSGGHCSFYLVLSKAGNGAATISAS